MTERVMRHVDQQRLAEANIKNLKRMRVLSGIDAVDGKDVSGVKVAQVDYFGSTIDDVSHGSDVKNILNQVFWNKDIKEIRLRGLTENLMFDETVDSPHNLAGAFRKLASLPDNELPDIISGSTWTMWPSVQTMEFKLREIVEKISYDSLTTGNIPLHFLINLMKIKPILRQAASESREKFNFGNTKEIIFDCIENLRNRGVIIIYSDRNTPNQKDLRSFPFSLPLIHHGVIGVGGIEITPDEKFIRLGSPQLADVTAISLWESKSREHHIQSGNSLATPMVAIGAGMILHKFPKLKYSEAGQRENFIIRTLNEAVELLPVQEIRSADRNNSFIVTERPVGVLNLKRLKKNLE